MLWWIYLNSDVCKIVQDVLQITDVTKFSHLKEERMTKQFLDLSSKCLLNSESRIDSFKKIAFCLFNLENNAGRFMSLHGK